MRLSNELVVAEPLDRVWAALLDVPRVAGALPGATIEGSPGADGHRGRMKVKLGAVTAEYAGVVRLEEVDDEARVARFRATGQEARGQGSAAATIAVRAVAEGGSTRVHVDTDLDVSGRQAQLGASMMQQVAGGVLDRFAEGLERELRGEPAGERGEALDLTAAVAGPLAERGLLVLAGLALGFGAGWLARGRR